MGTYTGQDKRLQYLFQNGGGGGGTTVIANPQGQATDTLNKLQVESTIYSILSGGGGGSVTTYHANWIASSSSATKTKLVDTVSLPAGKYIAIGRTPVPSTVQDIVIALSFNNVQDTSQTATVKNQYGNFVFYFELSQQTDVDLTTGQGSQLSWLSQYFDRGGMDIIKIESDDLGFYIDSSGYICQRITGD